MKAPGPALRCECPWSVLFRKGDRAVVFREEGRPTCNSWQVVNTAHESALELSRLACAGKPPRGSWIGFPHPARSGGPFRNMRAHIREPRHVMHFVTHPRRVTSSGHATGVAMTASAPLKSLLLQTAATIRTLEAEALHALHDGGDKETHRARLQAKCELLMALPQTAAPALVVLAPSEQKRVAAALDSFAARAGQATSIGSVFYMGALLYPDDYKEGEPNNLEQFIETIG